MITLSDILPLLNPKQQAGFVAVVCNDADCEAETRPECCEHPKELGVERGGKTKDNN